MKIHFYTGFNNYYNRKIIVNDSLQDYQDNLMLTINNVNFKPRDGINTEQIANTAQLIDFQMFHLDDVPDYAVVAEDDGEIISRWFVTQWDSIIYKNQYKATLRRDVVADNFDQIIEAPCFIEKATITDKQDPAIFNNENIGFNQIKRAESYLKDKSGCPWIVGYVPTNFDPTSQTSTGANENHCIRVKDINGNIYRANNMGPSTRTSLQSAPYAMFFMAYDDALAYVNSGLVGADTVASKNIALTLAMGISASVGADNVFDVQLLPYCPYQNGLYVISGTPQFSFNGLNSSRIDKITVNITGTGNNQIITETVEENVSRLFWATSNQFSLSIPTTLSNIDILMQDAISEPSTALQFKINNETNMFRICSPNYNGQFEFNPMKNHGVSAFEVDCTYQPFQPYIHVVPKFKTYNSSNTNLYGKDFDDVRGLICGGDFSLPQERNAWANYQQNNKNYQQIFDRQISNMEFNNRIAMWSQGISAVTGAAQGAGTGAFIGSGLSAAGGPIGAAIGGGLSAAGGIADTILLANQQKETLDYTKDQFGYQLGNIKAMPNSVSKTNPFTNNNKIFPVLEYYTCTDEEVKALEKKMEYNGMTIMRIGKIKDWLLSDYSYIKGKLIILEGISEEYHTALEIAQEIDKGIRAKKKEA